MSMSMLMLYENIIPAEIVAETEAEAIAALRRCLRKRRGKSWTPCPVCGVERTTGQGARTAQTMLAPFRCVPSEGDPTLAGPTAVLPPLAMVCGFHRLEPAPEILALIRACLPENSSLAALKNDLVHGRLAAL